MKKILFVAFLAFGCASMTMAFSHKHHKAPQQEMVSKQAKAVQDEGVEACSDTTDVAEDESDSLLAVAKMQTSKDVNVDHTGSLLYDLGFPSDVFSSNNLGGTLFAIFLFCMIFVLPFVVIILIIRYLIKRHNDNVRLTEMAMEKGYPLNSMGTIEKRNRHYNQRQWEKGVRQICIGAGLMVLFICLSLDALAGVGALLMFMGIGQLVIARSTRRQHEAESCMPETPVAEKPVDATPKAAEEEKGEDAFDPQI